MTTLQVLKKMLDQGRSRFQPPGRCKVGSGAESEVIPFRLFQPCTPSITIHWLFPPCSLPHASHTHTLISSYSSPHPLPLSPLSSPCPDLKHPCDAIQRLSLGKTPQACLGAHLSSHCHLAPVTIFSFILSCPVLPCPLHPLSLSSIQLAPNICHHPASIPHSS